jgi:hypothetical protein
MSEVKVNKISPRSGTEVTLGDSGDTFTIPSGATINNQGTATNFGATGSASWVTTVKTSTFTAVAGEGYFINTTGGAVSVNLPAGTAGAVVAVKDYAGTFDTNAVTLVQNGSDKIGGLTVNATLDVEGIAVTLVFIDSTQGWLVTDSGLQSEAPTAQYICASSPSVATVGDFKIHTFTGPGTFTVNSVGNAGGSNTVDYLVIGGGGSGAWDGGGGAGAGGYRFSNGTASGSYCAGPAPLGASALPVSVQGYPITVGAGGSPITSNTISNPGANSIFSTITAAGGGRGARIGQPIPHPGDGGSGGGVRGGSGQGSGNTPPVSPPQGNDGNTGPGNAGGGGGAGAAGTVGGGPSSPGGAGGVGLTSNITNTPTVRGGGGGGGADNPSVSGGAGGSGGGGTGGTRPSTAKGGDGTANTGGGGGGTGVPGSSGTGAGGSGIVIIRYKFQN